MERLPGQDEERAAPVDESFLAALGVHRVPVPVPFLEAGGPVNVYALADEGGGWTLFDCGVGTDEGLAAVRAGAAERGVDLKRVNRIIVSHGHVDHYGNAQTLSEECGARIFVHADDLEKVCGDGRWFRQLEQHWDYYLRLGLPEPTLTQMLEGTKRARNYARQVDRDKVSLLEPGQTLRFERFEARVLHLPGHTPGLVCLYAEPQKLLFADDHLLARVSPNPLLDLTLGEGDTKFRALDEYLKSARAVYELDLDCVLPGHGPGFTGHRALLDGLFDFYQRRQAKLVAHLEQGPATVFELLAAIFPRHDVPRLYLMLSEVLGNLEVLETQGRVRREAEGAFRFGLA